MNWMLIPSFPRAQKILPAKPGWLGIDMTPTWANSLLCMMPPILTFPISRTFPTWPPVGIFVTDYGKCSLTQSQSFGSRHSDDSNLQQSRYGFAGRHPSSGVNSQSLPIFKEGKEDRRIRLGSSLDFQPLQSPLMGVNIGRKSSFRVFSTASVNNLWIKRMTLFNNDLKSSPFPNCPILEHIIIYNNFNIL